MPEGLQKKIGPLPLWAWALIMGGVIGGVILVRRGQSTGTAGADVGTDTAGTIFPGATDGASGGSLTGTGGAPTLADGLTSFTTTVQQLKDAGLLWPDVATQGAPAAAAPGLIDIAPGHRYYDPTTGETIDGPESIAANSSTSAAPAGKKPTALQRAMAAVQSGKVGPVNRKRLQKAGFTNAQIDYHAKHKTPLKQPDKIQHPKPATSKSKNGKTTAKASAAATHPLQHVTAAQPNHAQAPAYRTVPGKDSHGRVGVFHVYADHRVFVPGH